MTDGDASTPAEATPGDLQGAIRAVRSGVPVREAARRFAVPRSTLADRVAQSPPGEEASAPTPGYPLAKLRAEVIGLERTLTLLVGLPAPEGLSAELLATIVREQLVGSYLLKLLRVADSNKRG